LHGSRETGLTFHIKNGTANVSSHGYHHGIAFTVSELNIGLWKWAIFPPSSVVGYAPASGTVLGNRKNAINAARQEIEAQDGHYVN
jgi:hypothetical protein